MIIKKTDIEGFGKFKNKSIDFDKGFNLIFGKNEDGKTTLMNFIMMMFYSSSGKTEKGQDLLKIPRKKYRPWDGSIMAGSVEFEILGKEYRLRKEFLKSGATDKSTLLCKTTGEYEKIAVPNEAGKNFLNMSPDEFERSIFVSGIGGFSSDASADSLAMRIANLSTSGNEAVSSDLISKRIDNAICELISKNGKKGLLVEARAKVDELESEKQKILRQIDIQSDLFAEIAELESKIFQAEAMLNAMDVNRKIESATKELNAYYELNNKLNLLENIKKQLMPYNKSLAELEEHLSIAEKISTEISNATLRLEEASAKKASDIISDGEFLKIDGLRKSISDLKLDIEKLDTKIANIQKTYDELLQKSSKKARNTSFIVTVLLAFLGGLSAVSALFVKVPALFAVSGTFLVAALLSVTVIPKYFLKKFQKSSVIQNVKNQLDLALNSLTDFDENFENKSVSDVKVILEKKVSDALTELDSALKKYNCRTFDELKSKASYFNDTEISNISEIINRKKDEFILHLAKIKNVDTYIAAKILFNELSDSIKTFKTITSDISTICSATGILCTSRDDVKKKIKELVTFLQSAPKTNTSDVSADKLEADLRALRLRLGECQSRIQLPEKSEGEIDKLIQIAKARRDELSQRYRELQTASEVLAEAILEANKGFGSFLSKKTAEYLSKLSDKRYNNVLVSRSLNIEAQTTDGEAYHDWKYLSGGAIDKVYLALRLAATDILTKDSGPLPLFLDDILMQYDDESCKSTLVFLKEYLETSGSVSQILFFTCHQHIAEMIKNIFNNIREITL